MTEPTADEHDEPEERLTGPFLNAPYRCGRQALYDAQAAFPAEAGEKLFPPPSFIPHDEALRMAALIAEQDRPLLDRLAASEQRDAARAAACADLAEFLLARYAEHEHLANRLLGRIEAYKALDPDIVVASTGSPAMMLAAVDAKRRIVDRCRPRWVIVYDDAERRRAAALNWPTFQVEAWSNYPAWPFPQAELILRDLGVEFAKHDDYRDEWKP